MCTVTSEAWQIVSLSVVRKEGEADADYNTRVEEARAQIHQRMLLLIHAVVQVGNGGGGGRGGHLLCMGADPPCSSMPSCG